MKRKYYYILKGEPYSLIRYENTKPQPGNSHSKFDQIFFSIELERQHDGCELIKGPVHLDATFYISAKSCYKKETVAFGSNSISKFVHGLETICVGTLIKSSVMVSSCSAKRFYAKTPSIEFSITEI